MNFYRLRELSAQPHETIFRESRFGKSLSFVISLTISVTLASVGYYYSGWYYYFAAVMGLYSLMCLSGLRASLGESNWLMRWDGDRLFIKYRSYLNYNFPKDDPVVVEVGISEIDWIRAFREIRIFPGVWGGGTNAE